MKKVMQQGNEAIARGAWEAGVKIATAYPGTPSSEILQEMTQYKEVYTEWSPNEKVAVEVAAGAAVAGARSMASMKHVGLNVASDPFMTLAYTGIKGGLVIVVCDDPFVHSSQNEQDSRNWARFAKVPMFEPGDAQECHDFMKLAFDVSEQFDTPVLLRGETRVCHADSPVVLGERKESTMPLGLDPKMASKYVMVPANVRVRRPIVEERMKKLEAYADKFKGNRMEINDKNIGVITSGASYMYTKDVFPNYSYLKLGMVWPLPKKMLAEFFKKVKKVIIVEELDPFLETEIRALGYKVWHGKDIVPTMFELTPRSSRNPSKGRRTRRRRSGSSRRTCPGDRRTCAQVVPTGRSFTRSRSSARLSSATSAATPSAWRRPFRPFTRPSAWAASIGQAYGAGKALGKEGLGKVCAVIGDSTFLHGGVAPLMDTVYNKGYSTTIICDNRITGMTGLQEHPGTGYTAKGEPANMVNYPDLARALGIKNVRTIDPYNVLETMGAIREELNRDEASVIVTQQAPAFTVGKKEIPESGLPDRC